MFTLSHSLNERKRHLVELYSAVSNEIEKGDEGKRNLLLPLGTQQLLTLHVKVMILATSLTVKSMLNKKKVHLKEILFC